MSRGEHLRSITCLGRTLKGKTLGLIGMGAIARSCAEIFSVRTSPSHLPAVLSHIHAYLNAQAAFHCPVHVYSPTTSPLAWTSSDPKSLSPLPHTRHPTLSSLLTASDVVVVACPLNDQTRGLLGEPEFRAMKPEAVLVNVARGWIVQEPALEKALREGWIAGAGVDVSNPLSILLLPPSRSPAVALSLPLSAGLPSRLSRKSTAR